MISDRDNIMLCAMQEEIPLAIKVLKYCAIEMSEIEQPVNKGVLYSCYYKNEYYVSSQFIEQIEHDMSD